MKWRRKGITRHRWNKLVEGNKKNRKNLWKYPPHRIREMDKIPIDDIDLRKEIGASHIVEDPDPLRTKLEQRFAKAKKKLTDKLYDRLKLLYGFEMDIIADEIIKERLKSCKKKKRF